jgi:hypothetical protein
MEDSDSINNNEKYYFYVKPTIRGSSVSLVIIIIIFFVWLIFKWSYTYMNWDSEKCKNLNFYFAPIYKQDSTKTFNECVSNQVSEQVQTAINNVGFSQKIDNVNTDIQKLTDAYSQVKSNGPGIVNNYNEANNEIVKKIKENIINVKNTLSKVMGSVIVSSYLNNGVIQATKSLNSGINPQPASADK